MMKASYLFATMMLFCCLCVWGQQPSHPSKQEPTPCVSVQSAPRQQEYMLQLKAENEALKKQLENVEKEIASCREDVRAKITELDNAQARWLVILTVVIGAIVSILGIGLGVVSPLLLNYKNDKKQGAIVEKLRSELKGQIESAANDAKSTKESLAEVLELKSDIDAIKKDIDKSKKNAERAAKRALASKTFTQALAEKDAAKAIELYSKVIALFPSSSEALNNRGLLKAELGDQAGAMADFDRAIALNPNDADVYNNRGVLKKNMGDAAGALQDYEKAIALNPDDSAGYNNRGALKVDMGNQEGALQDYNKALELNPNDGSVYNNRGALKDEMGDAEGALQDYNKAIELKPNESDGYNNRADLLLKGGETELALFDANMAIEKNGSNYVHFVTRGEIYAAMGRYGDATSDFSKAISLKADSKEAYEFRAKCYRQWAEAEQDEAQKAVLTAKAEADQQKIALLQKEHQ